MVNSRVFSRVSATGRWSHLVLCLGVYVGGQKADLAARDWRCWLVTSCSSSNGGLLVMVVAIFWVALAQLL